MPEPTQLVSLSISGLFGELNHVVEFPQPSVDGDTPALVILHGQNGVGKTTVLAMLDGLLRLDFNVFRRVPFDSAELRFTDSPAILVEAANESSLQHISVSFQDHHVKLNPKDPGPLDTDGDGPVAVEEFRAAFFSATNSIAFELIDTERISGRLPPHAMIPEEALVYLRTRDGRIRSRNPKAKQVEDAASLAERVAKFIGEAQVNYRSFFASTEPDLFPKILERLTASKEGKAKPDDLRVRLRDIRHQDERTERLGLEVDPWDFDQLDSHLDRLSKDRGPGKSHALTVLSTYVETLESRAAERRLIADRLFTFERLMDAFFRDKEVRVHPKDGMHITTTSGTRLNETQLSSGEFHLLFLMVSALATKRRGTVVAIDEPEMSMHIEWQRKLVPALLECASNAEPLFILATHSPDLAVSYPEALVELRRD